MKTTVSGHISCVPSAISEQKIKEALQKVVGHHCIVSSSVVSVNGHEQLTHLREYSDSSCKGKPICGYMIHFTQDNTGSFYQITGLDEGPQIIGQALESCFV